MENLGDNLSNIQNVMFLEANSEQELQNLFDKFTLPTRIITIYRGGTRVYAWVETMNKVVKVKKVKKLDVINKPKE
jgi:hypothetical protein